MLKYCYIDLETTGNVSGLSEICQISGILENPENEKTFEFSFNVRPFDYKNLDIYQNDALEKTNLTIEQIMNFDPAEIVYQKLTSIFSKIVDKYNKSDKMFFIGYNSYFNWEFMYKWFELNNDPYFGSYFWFPPIDVCQLAAISMMDIRHTFKNFKLETVCEAFGFNIDATKTHNSLYDIQITRELFKKITA